MKGLGIGTRGRASQQKRYPLPHSPSFEILMAQPAKFLPTRHHAMGDYNYFQIELILQNSTTRSNTAQCCNLHGSNAKCGELIQVG